MSNTCVIYYFHEGSILVYNISSKDIQIIFFRILIFILIFAIRSNNDFIYYIYLFIYELIIIIYRSISKDIK
jgi:hypothetical protein